jgi:hypothetical protein
LENTQSKMKNSGRQERGRILLTKEIQAVSSLLLWERICVSGNFRKREFWVISGNFRKREFVVISGNFVVISGNLWS